MDSATVGVCGAGVGTVEAARVGADSGAGAGTGADVAGAPAIAGDGLEASGSARATKIPAITTVPARRMRTIDMDNLELKPRGRG
jgi:hypothetical protein